jgi:uncharacterized protein YecE (DUF72 family)
VAVLIGTSGWQYQHWKGGFYPRGLPVGRWLGQYAQRFATVEVNNAFYRLPEMSTFESWAAAVPEDFCFAVKASRYLTHVRRLREPQEPVRRLLERAAGLGSRLGPVLLQLPPNLRADLDALDEVLAAFGKTVRVAVEFRHDSWYSSQTRSLLERHAAACCLADTEGKGPPRWRTADWGYVRFHRGRAQPDSCYGRTALQSWAGELAALWPKSADVYAYFNNDAHGCAPRNASQFAGAVARAGGIATRVPTSRQAPVAAA